jgi:hypothetical protein
MNQQNNNDKHNKNNNSFEFIANRSVARPNPAKNIVFSIAPDYYTDCLLSIFAFLHVSKEFRLNGSGKELHISAKVHQQLRSKEETRIIA